MIQLVVQDPAKFSLFLNDYINGNPSMVEELRERGSAKGMMVMNHDNNDYLILDFADNYTMMLVGVYKKFLTPTS